MILIRVYFIIFFKSSQIDNVVTYLKTFGADLWNSGLWFNDYSTFSSFNLQLLSEPVSYEPHHFFSKVALFYSGLQSLVSQKVP